ncbi:MAG: hypothetical protein ABJH85_14520 [Paracoccaceae bacterium]
MHDLEMNTDRGAGPFVTFRHLHLPDGHRIWLARNHRRGVGAVFAPRPFWQYRAFNGVMAVGFAIGSMLFAVGAALSLFPAFSGDLSSTERDVNRIFFIGSLFFTLSAYLQVFQSANAGEKLVSKNAPSLRSYLGWRPKDPGWLSSSAQFAGTILFNLNTYDAFLGGGWLRQDVLIWVPDMLGSLLFLFSGYLAVVETCHDWWAWRPRTLAWWIVMVNFAGCVAFMASALLAFVPPSGASVNVIAVSTFFTLFGAMGFFLGALLAMYECISKTDPTSRS